MNRPLDGVVVVALEQAVAAPFCTARLADAGARVIKVERAEGDFARSYDQAVHGESAYFVWLNRGKQSIVLDIKDPDDAGLLTRILGRADVFVQNLAPGAAARAGFGSAALRARHPDLITCDISGYGEDGPFSAMKAYDFLIQCETALASITGTAEGASRVGVSVADIACGMNAHAAILQALYAREKTGQGQGVAVSLFDGLAEWMTVPLLYHDYAGSAPARMGLNHATLAPYGAYVTGDGRWTVIAVQSDREWRSFCEIVLGEKTLADDDRIVTNPLRCQNRSFLDGQISMVLTGLSQSGLIARLRAANIAYGALNEVADLSRHSQLRRVRVQTPTGPVAMPAAAPRWSSEAALGAVPALNADGAAIREEFV